MFKIEAQDKNENIVEMTPAWNLEELKNFCNDPEKNTHYIDCLSDLKTMFNYIIIRYNIKLFIFKPENIKEEILKHREYIMSL